MWNSTVANLSLMALGSSIPEILLAVFETIGTLWKCPGELGASTIVGSAAFNLLVISGVSIYAVTEENDTHPERDPDCPLGIKKIKQQNVFFFTATVSMIAYILMWVFLIDQIIKPWEAWITLFLFFALIGVAWIIDKFSEGDEDEEEEITIPQIEFTPLEIYRELLNEKKGEVDMSDMDATMKRKRMKAFLMETCQTDQIEMVTLEQLKQKVEGVKLTGNRTKYRKTVSSNSGRSMIGKYEVIKLEHTHADNIDEKLKNSTFGFKCLHYSVSEASESLSIVILNKTGEAGKVFV